MRCSVLAFVLNELAGRLGRVWDKKARVGLWVHYAVPLASPRSELDCRSIKRFLWRLLGENLKDSFRSELDCRPIKRFLWRLLGENLKDSFRSELDCRSIKRFLWRLHGEGLEEYDTIHAFGPELDCRSIKWFLWRLHREGLKEYDTIHAFEPELECRSIKRFLWRLLGENLKDSFRSELDCRSIKRFLWCLLGEDLKGQSWIVDLSSGCFTTSSVKFLKLDSRNALRLSGIKFWQARLGRFPRELLDFFGLATEYFGCPLSANGSTLLGVAKLSVPNTRPLLLQSCDLPSANDGRLVKATRSAIEIASVPTDSTSRNNRFCPGAKLRVSTKASDFSREIEVPLWENLWDIWDIWDIWEIDFFLSADIFFYRYFKKKLFQVDTSLPLFLQPARCSLDDEVEEKSPEFWQCAVVVVDTLAWYYIFQLGLLKSHKSFALMSLIVFS
ncbi:hypothetical protein BDC45DRAFT_561613 [Circinella umbellata]|nr:hypothetical protein BDC45DRAFT_561613 [Circinella umbellata]